MAVNTRVFLSVLCVFLAEPLAGQSTKMSKAKRNCIQYVDEQQGSLIKWGNKIWEYAEPSLEDTKSAALLVDIFRKEGFRVDTALCGMPTVFVASYGTVQPVIGLYGEYDADADASNKVVPRRDPIVEDGYGHGGHHNLLGIGSVGAALTIKRLIKEGKLKCTIRYYGTTAEGSAGAKAYLARDGYFDDLDLSLYWHPAPATSASTRTWDALIDFDVVFAANKVNVIRDAIRKSTTLDAVEMMVGELKKFRERMSPTVRLNYNILQRKSELDEIADTMRIALRIQCAKQEDALGVFDDIAKAVKQVASNCNVNSETKVHRAMHQFLPNVTGTSVVHHNMMLLGPTEYTDEEQRFTRALQQEIDLPANGIEDKISPFADESDRSILFGYASDIGDPSWIAPEVYFVVRTLPGVPMHQWPGTIFSAHSIGHKGMLKAAKILSMTIVDYVENEKLQQDIRTEFERKRKGYRYRSLLTK